MSRRDRRPALRRVRLDRPAPPPERRRSSSSAPPRPRPSIRERARAIVEAVRTAATPRSGTRTAASAAACASADGAPAPLSHRPRRAARCPRPTAARPARGLETMATNIERFHAVQVPPAEQWVEVEPGIEVGRVWRGLDRVAAYVPGGTRRLPVVAADERHPGAPRGRARASSSPARPGATGRSPLPCSAQRASMEVEEFCGHGRRPGHRRPSPTAPSRSSPVDKIVGPGQRLGHGGQARGARSRAPSTCPPARPRSWSSPTTRPIPSTSRPTCSARPSTGPTPLPCW